MPEYTVQWNYKTGTVGPFTEGSTVILSVEEADQINRDSPGVLVEVEAKTPSKKLKSKPANRLQKEAETRQEPITSDTFKAVKNKGD